MDMKTTISIISLVIVCISLIASVVAMSTDMRSDIDYQDKVITKLNTQNDLCQQRLNEVEKRNDIIDVKLTQIQTDLAEIKVDLKKLNMK